MNVYTPFYSSDMTSKVDTIIHETVHATSWNEKIYRVEGADSNQFDSHHTPRVEYGNQTTERVARSNAAAFVAKYSWSL